VDKCAGSARRWGVVRSRALVLTLAVVAGCASRAGVPPGDPVCTGGEKRPDGLLVAGSGSVLPLARALAERWRTVHPESRVHVPESISSGGAVRALGDGAIDVGLASRVLTDGEKARLRVLPVARSIVHLAAHPRGAPRTLTRAQVLEVFAGRLRAWPDGTPIIPHLREAGDSGYAVLAKTWPELHAAMTDGLKRERFTICYTDQEMRDALAQTEGSIGLLDSGIVQMQGLPLATIALDEKLTLEKPLSLLLPQRASEEAERFAAFARAPEQADLIRAGALLLP
jgi:phosphate transport system substrate-binding protein